MIRNVFFSELYFTHERVRGGDLADKARVCKNLFEILVNPIMTFLIKKRINTELFIDGKIEFYSLFEGLRIRTCNDSLFEMTLTVE